ncbi:MAG: hypothetical protein PF481_04115 [Bacteroidales bacterium]|nr:hypothetical protein [Bacteroidales bacterium]
MRSKIFEYSICFITIVAIFPFIINSAYVHPAIDDYAHAYRLFNASIWETVTNIYLTWSGRYFGTLISYINPLLYSNTMLSALYSISIIALSVASIYFLLFSLSTPKLTKLQICALTSIVIVPFLTYIPDVYSYFYWFSGYITYTIANSALLFLIAVIYNYIRKPHSFILTLLIVTALSFIIAGSNEFALIQTHSIFILGLLSLKNARTHPHYYIFYAVFLLFSLIFFAAPGNYQRAEICNVSVSITDAAYISLFYTKEFFIRYAGMFLSAGCIYLTIFAPALHRPKKVTDIHPFTIAIFGIGMLFVLQFFSLYATFTALLYRTENSTVLLAIFIWIYFLQQTYSRWIIHTKPQKILQSKTAKIISIIVFLGPAFSPNSSIAVSYKDLLLGESKAYSETRTIQDELLQNASGHSSVEIPALRSYPETLLPKRFENQESISRLLFYFDAQKFYSVDTIIIHHDTISRHPYFHTKLWNYESEP